MPVQGGRGIARDPGQALHYFEEAAESGNAVAMAFLGKYTTLNYFAICYLLLKIITSSSETVTFRISSIKK